MSALLQSLGLALFPAVGTVVASAVALRVQLSKQHLSFVLHLAAGVVFGVVAVELVPRSLDARPAWVVLAVFVAGSVFYVLADWTADVIGARRGGDNSKGVVWAIVFGVGLDMLTDGMMIAAGESLGQGLGLLLALGLVVADSPEAFSTIAALAAYGASRRSQLLVAASFPVLILLGAPLGTFLVSGRPEIVKVSTLMFTAGILVLVVVEGMVPEAHAQGRREAGKAALLFTFGFTLFAFLSLYVG